MPWPVPVSTVQDVANARSYICNITAPVVVKSSGQARLVRISIVGDDGTAGACYDCAALASTAASNQIVSVPASAAGSVIMLNWPLTAGLVVAPGNGQTLAVSLA